LKKEFRGTGVRRRSCRSQEFRSSGVQELQESGVRSQESGVRSQESGVRSQESGVRSQESGVRSQESGVRSRHENPECEEEHVKGKKTRLGKTIQGSSGGDNRLGVEIRPGSESTANARKDSLGTYEGTTE